tara:strand:+ start:307 stop:627 length:321 start_codon:yes stop_codon:yes gene_type:complete
MSASKFTPGETTAFQTGRLYDADGQIITLHKISSQCLAFRDHARGIDGVIHHQGLGADDESYRGNERLALTAYDHGLYSWPKTDEEREGINLCILTDKTRKLLSKP